MDDEAHRKRLEDAFIVLAEHVQHNNPNQTQFEKYSRNNPPTYHGIVDPVILENWIRETEKLFEVVGTPANLKVTYATYYLKGEADRWWDLTKGGLLARPVFGWEEFKTELKNRFYPEFIRWAKRQEFTELVQGNMSVQAFTNKFTELARFAATLVADEAEKTRYYEWKLNPKIGSYLVSTPSQNVDQAYNRALGVESMISAVPGFGTNTESVTLGKTYLTTCGSARFKRMRPKFRGGPSTSQSDIEATCLKCKKPYHPGKNCDGTDLVCYGCGKPGHFANRCPDRAKNTGKDNRSVKQGRVYVLSRDEAEADPDAIAACQAEGHEVIIEEDLETDSEGAIE